DAVHEDVVDVLLGEIAAQSAAHAIFSERDVRDEAEDVHQPVPANRERAEAEKDRIELGMDEHGAIITPMAAKLRSFTITHGVARSPNRSMLRAIGYKDEDFEKPIVWIANGQSSMNPSNAGILPLTDAAVS